MQEYGLLDEASVAKSIQFSNVVINLAGQRYTSRFRRLAHLFAPSVLRLIWARVCFVVSV